MILATGAVHAHLCASSLRTFTSLNVRSAECLDMHLLRRADRRRRHHGQRLSRGGLDRRPPRPRPVRQAQPRRLPQPLSATRSTQGLLKIMSKMGISVISSYRGGCNFEAVGLSRTLVAEYLPRHAVAHLRHRPRRHPEARRRAARARLESRTSIALPIGGFYRYRKGGETHAWAARCDPHRCSRRSPATSYPTFKRYSEMIAKAPPVALRDLLDFVPTGKPHLARRGRERSPRSASASSRPACRWARCRPRRTARSTSP